jgi:hypothetical protein
MIYLYLIAALLTGPLGLEWQKKQKRAPEINDYRHYVGAVHTGETVYLGKKDFVGLETELQLKYAKGLLSKATLILGPSGLNHHNCVSKTKSVVKLLNEKYGHFKYQKVLEMPMIDELVHSGPCQAVKAGLSEFQTTWVLKEFEITSKLVGDEDGFYIEIEYVYISRKKAQNKQDRKKLLKAL